MAGFNGTENVWSESGQLPVIVTHLLECVVILVVWAIIFALLYNYYKNRKPREPQHKEPKVTVMPQPPPKHPIELGKDLPYDYKTTVPTSSNEQKASLDIITNDVNAKQSTKPKDQTTSKDDKTSLQTTDEQKNSAQVQDKRKDQAKVSDSKDKAPNFKPDQNTKTKTDPKAVAKTDAKGESKIEPKINSKDKTIKLETKDQAKDKPKDGLKSDGNASGGGSKIQNVNTVRSNENK